MNLSIHVSGVVIAAFLGTSLLTSCGSSDMGQPMQTGSAGTATLPPAPMAQPMAASATRGVAPEGTVAMGNASIAGAAATESRPMDGQPNLAVEGTPGVQGSSDSSATGGAAMDEAAAGGAGVGGEGAGDGFGGDFGPPGQGDSTSGETPTAPSAGGAPASSEFPGSDVGGASSF